MIYGFPSVAAIVALIAVHFRVVNGGHPALYVIPPAVWLITYLGMRRVFVDKTLPRTVHDYSLFAPTTGSPTLAFLVERLSAKGYEVDALSVDEQGKIGPRPGHALDLIGSGVRITDKRADPELGGVIVRLRRTDDGTLVGLVEATDTGPGVYDEMAQFLLVELAEVIPALEYAALSRSQERRSAQGLRDELPKEPLGLGLL
jgi:hypothetical protein